jgi:Tfp pilus assembly protein PilF
MCLHLVKNYNNLFLLWFITLVWFLSACTPTQEKNQPPSAQELRARWHNNQGVVYMDQHNYTRGREAFQRAVELDPHYADAHTNLGISHYSLGQYDSAAVALQSALREDADHLRTHYVLGLIYNVQGQENEKALKSFQKVVQGDANDPLVHYYLGQIQAKLGRTEEALSEFRHTIRLDPYNVSGHYAMANLLRKSGRPEAARAALLEFTRLNQAGYEGISQSYQGQGKYAEATADISYADAADTEVRTQLSFAAAPTPPTTTPRLATLVDFDRDGDLDLFTGDTQLRLWRGDQGTFASAETIDLPKSAAARHALFGDWDNDGDPDLVLSGPQTLLATNNDGALKVATLLSIDAHEAVFADTDHDGDLDLLLLGNSGCRLLSNDGAGAFVDITEQAQLTGTTAAHQALFSDFDNDRDIDFLVRSQDGLQLFTNNRDGTFADIATDLQLAAVSAVGIAVEDFNQDSYMDISSVSADGVLTLYTNGKGRALAPRTLPDAAASTRGLQAADFDNDGDFDLLTFGVQGIQLFTHFKNAFERENQDLGDDVSRVLIADFNGDGTEDIWADGHLWHNATSGNHWIEIVVQGLNSNPEGIGTKIEVKTTQHQQKREVRGGGSDSRILRFGLGRQDSVEFIRLLWPGGVRQSELATAADQRLQLTELNRKGTSCPILYAWDGEQFRFVTDILGGGIIGYLIEPGQYYTPDTDEYVPLDVLAPKDGKYVLQITNQLEEIIYLDAVSLVAVDHPVGTTVYPNERLLSAPPYPEFDLYPLENLRPLHAVTDHRGTDVSAQLRSVDDEWYEGFGHTRIHGYAQDHSLTLDLGDLDAMPHPVLLAYGWVDYAHSSSNWAAAQSQLDLYPPRLEVADGHGGWQLVTTDMGCPAGLPKHMLFDLQGIFPTPDYRLRITTNTPLYWDQFLVGNRAALDPQFRRLPVQTADLHWRGYPAHTAVKGTFAFRYHYDRLQDEQDWGTHSGAFTRLGKVTELLHEVDDRYVIMFHGDELTIEFPAADLPPPAPGHLRRFMLYADGFGKDMDYHSAHSLEVGPLPFHAMSSYPYPANEHYPQSEAHLDYLLQYNTRLIKGFYE